MLIYNRCTSKHFAEVQRQTVEKKIWQPLYKTKPLLSCSILLAWEILSALQRKSDCRTTALLATSSKRCWRSPWHTPTSFTLIWRTYRDFPLTQCWSRSVAVRVLHAVLWQDAVLINICNNVVWFFYAQLITLNNSYMLERMEFICTKQKFIILIVISLLTAMPSPTPVNSFLFFNRWPLVMEVLTTGKMWSASLGASHWWRTPQGKYI